MTVQVRPEAEADRDAVRGVVRAAFGDDGEMIAALVDAMREDHAGIAGASLVAVDEGQVVGHVGLTRGWVDAPDRLVTMQVLSPLSVLPDLQGRGMGAALLAAAARRAEELGAPLVLLEGDPGYYGRHGYVAAAGLGLERPSDRIPGPACQVLPLPGYDASITGRLVYPDIFWRFDSVGLRGVHLAQIERALSEPRLSEPREER